MMEMHPTSRSRHPIRRRAAFVAATLAAAALLGACGDPLGLRASLAVQFDTLFAYAMTGTPSGFPSAYNATAGVAVRIEPDIAFDIALDLDPSNRIRLIPPRLIASTRQLGGGLLGNSPRVGLQLGQGTFESITKAPGTGYKHDTTLVVDVHQPALLELASDACQFSIGTLLYAKLVVDSVNADTRQIWFRVSRDPNCGFRSLQTGVPKN
jgi:hypothetical protein